jgi:hypothetical protein
VAPFLLKLLPGRFSLGFIRDSFFLTISSKRTKGLRRSEPAATWSFASNISPWCPIHMPMANPAVDPFASLSGRCAMNPRSAGHLYVCAVHGTNPVGCKSRHQVCVEPKVSQRASASSRDRVQRKPKAKSRGDEQRPHMKLSPRYSVLGLCHDINSHRTISVTPSQAG